MTMDNSEKGLGKSASSQGGKRRAEVLAPEDRKAIAREAASARWSQNLPRATHSGRIEIASRVIECAVLEDGTRLLSQQSFLLAIGRGTNPKAGTGSEKAMGEGSLPPFLAAANLGGFIDDELRKYIKPVMFRSARGIRSFGYNANLLPAVCEVYLKAKDAGKIVSTQEKVVEIANLLMRGFARVGIVALVDEATGYQEERKKDELSKILAAYISPELLPYVSKFPTEFFKQIYRIYGWKYDPNSTKRPQVIGKLINKWIYDKLPTGVLSKLQEVNPVTEKGYRKYKNFQYLTVDTGNRHLDRLIVKVITLLQISDSVTEFDKNFTKAFSLESEFSSQSMLVVEVFPGKKGRKDIVKKSRKAIDVNDQDLLF